MRCIFPFVPFQFTSHFFYLFLQTCYAPPHLKPSSRKIKEAERALVLAGDQVHEINVRVRMPQTFSTHSLPIVADVTWDGQRLGEVAEAIAYW